jgi:cysteine desulfurase
MSAVLRDEFGNPSSVHHFGQRAKAAVDEARSAVADLHWRRPVGGRLHQQRAPKATISPFGAPPRRSSRRPAAPDLERHRARGGAEHAQGAGPARLADHLLPWAASGLITAEALRPPSPTRRQSSRSCTPTTNRHVQPVAELARLAKAAGAVVHTDAVQTAGKIR